MNTSFLASSTFSTPSSASSWFSGFVRVPRPDMSATLKMSGYSGVASTAAISGPADRKSQFRGVLFKYGPNPIQVAFKTGDFTRKVIFIGGLTDGFLATAYLEPLAIALDRENWSLVQFLMSSSYSGYGTSSLQQDAKDLDQLINYLINKEDSEGVVLLGHSTGCQDIVHYMRTNFVCSRAVRAAIFQAPVSDREYRATLPETASMIDLAANMISEGRGTELMPREADPCSPITAYRICLGEHVNVVHDFEVELREINLNLLAEIEKRKQAEESLNNMQSQREKIRQRYHSLCSYNGDDDLFSSDLSDDQLKMRLGHMSSTHCQVIFSMGDEYVPEYVDKKALVERLCRAMGGAEKVEIEYGNHSLSNRVEEAVQAIIDFLKREGPKGWDDPWN